MVYSMKSIYVIQEVKVLPRVTANHRPGSETRWQEETNVRSRVDRVDRLCIELRNRTNFVVQDVRPRTDKGINIKATPESPRCEPRTVSTCWNATSKATPKVSRQGGHRSRRPEACRSRDDTGTRESLIVSCCSQSRIINGETLRGSPPRYQSSHRKDLHRKVDPCSTKGGERRYDVTSRKAKERRMDARQS
jgi:hypothetical protein